MPVKMTFKIDREKFIGALQEDIYTEQRDMFELDIVPEAKKNSPVTPEGLAHNIELKKKRPGGTGDNRRSIDAETTMTEDGVESELFTQSGHGAYLELGTARMRPQPYLYPAFQKFIIKLAGRIKARRGQ